MTLEELMVEFYEQMGEPTDIEPRNDSEVFDLTEESAQRSRRILNNGQTAIAMWRFPNGTIHKIRELEGTLFFKTTVLSGTAQNGGPDTITLAAGSGSVADQYKGWLVKITGGTGEGQLRLILSFDESNQQCEVDEDWDTVPDTTSEYELYKALYQFVDPSNTISGQNIPISPVDQILTMYAITDVKSQIRLYPVERTDTLSAFIKSHGIPSAFYEQNGGVKFNVAVDERRPYAIDYVKMPKALVDKDDVPEMPEQYHMAIVMWATWWYYRMKQESGAAYAAKRDLDDYLGRIQSQDSRKYDRMDGRMSVEGFGDY